jgi:hypothetical protein
MELTSWYVILGGVIVVIAVIERFAVYSILVKHKRWLPEKATNVANMMSGITLGLGILALVGKAIFFSH